MPKQLIETGQKVFVERIESNYFSSFLLEMDVVKHNKTSFYVKDGQRESAIRINQNTLRGNGSVFGLNYRVWTTKEAYEEYYAKKKERKELAEEVKELLGRSYNKEQLEKIRDFLKAI